MTTTITTLADVHPDIIHTHILPRLAGASPSATTTTVSSYLQALCSDDDLWANISKSTWPSITYPRVDDIITTFAGGHRSFFEDSFPLLITDVNHRNHRSVNHRNHRSCNESSHLWPSELISAVDMRYQNDIVYSTVEFTDTRADFLSSTLAIELNKEKNSKASGIGLSIGSKAGDINIDVTNEATLSHVKESVTLNWIIINPTSKRAGNLSSIKPVSVRPGWMPNQTILRYKTVLPGCDPNEMVECRIEVVLGGVGDGDEGLHVQEVVLKLLDMDSVCLNGREFLVITQGAILEENNVRRRVVDDEGRLRSYKEYKRVKRGKLARAKKEKDKIKYIVGIWCVFSFLFISFCYYNNIL